MPHINIKCYPKGLTEQELKTLAEDLAALIGERLNTPKEYVSIAYAEVELEDWKKEVYEVEIKPNLNKLLRKPEYEM